MYLFIDTQIGERGESMSANATVRMYVRSFVRRTQFEIGKAAPTRSILALLFGTVPAGRKIIRNAARGVFLVICE